MSDLGSIPESETPVTPIPENTPIEVPQPTVEQRANNCLADINGALRKHGFDIQVFHELTTVKNAQGGTEIQVQHVQKFVPMVAPSNDK